MIWWTVPLNSAPFSRIMIKTQVFLGRPRLLFGRLRELADCLRVLTDYEKGNCGQYVVNLKSSTELQGSLLRP